MLIANLGIFVCASMSKSLCPDIQTYISFCFNICIKTVHFLHHPYYHNNQAAEVKDYGKIQELDVGSWTTSVGLDMKDDLFPHVTGGMRGRRIMVASLEVRIQRDDNAS